MIIIVGLGNPGEKYKKTRHNIGFMTVDSLQLTVNSFSHWEPKKRFDAEISMGKIDNKKIILAKPQTFMNLSGRAIESLLNFYKTTRTVLVVIHDDIDIPLGKIRISKGRGAAGHKGVESIIKELDTKNFVRFRIGIKLKQSYRLVYRTEDFVLQKFSKEEEKTIREVIKKTVDAIEFAIKEGIEKARTKFNK